MKKAKVDQVKAIRGTTRSPNGAPYLVETDLKTKTSGSREWHGAPSGGPVPRCGPFNLFPASFANNSPTHHLSTQDIFLSKHFTEHLGSVPSRSEDRRSELGNF